MRPPQRCRPRRCARQLAELVAASPISTGEFRLVMTVGDFSFPFRRIPPHGHDSGRNCGVTEFHGGAGFADRVELVPKADRASTQFRGPGECTRDDPAEPASY